MSENGATILPLQRESGSWSGYSANGTSKSSAGPDSHPSSRPLEISFNRRELSQILAVYGRKVASGEWRDYAIDCLKEKAVFSIFRRTSETPLYRIEKAPKLARKQGAYSVIATSGHILKRGHDLARVLRSLDKGLSLVEG